jgi:hypothetical protein
VALQSVSLTGTTPRLQMVTIRFGLERMITMQRGANVPRVRWTKGWSDGSVTPNVGVLADFRDYHSRSFANGPSRRPSLRKIIRHIGVRLTKNISAL